MHMDTTVENIMGNLRTFLLEELLDADDISEIDADENIIQSGFIDSMGAVRLAMHIEEAFGFAVEPVDFTLENFRTLSSLAAFIMDKKALA